MTPRCHAAQWFRIAFPRNYLDRRKRAGFLFVLPALLFFGSVFILPLAQSIMYSFYKIAPGGAKEFVGLRLYEKVLTDSTSGPPSGTPSSCCCSPCPRR